MKLFQSLNPDPKLLAELYPTQLNPPLLPVELPNMVDVHHSSSVQVLIKTEEERLVKELQQDVSRSQPLYDLKTYIDFQLSW